MLTSFPIAILSFGLPFLALPSEAAAIKIQSISGVGLDSTDYLLIRKVSLACALVFAWCPLGWLLVPSAALDSIGVRPEHQKLPLMWSAAARGTLSDVAPVN